MKICFGLLQGRGGTTFETMMENAIITFFSWFVEFYRTKTIVISTFTAERNERKKKTENNYEGDSWNYHCIMTGSGGSLVIMNVKKFRVTNASSWSTEEEAEMQIQRDIMPWAGCLVPGDTNIVNIDIEKNQKHFV